MGSETIIKFKDKWAIISYPALDNCTQCFFDEYCGKVLDTLGIIDLPCEDFNNDRGFREI